MTTSFLEAVWFFLPLSFANIASGIMRKHKAPFMEIPVHERWFGENKTWGAYLVAVRFAVAVALIQYLFREPMESYALYEQTLLNNLLIGVLFGLGAVLGDHVESFVKRRIRIRSGNSLPILDQLDFALGGAALVYLVGYQFTLTHFLIFLCFVLCYYIPGNAIGLWRGHRSKLF